MNLYTGAELHSHQWDNLPLTADAINRVQEIAKNQNQPLLRNWMPIFEWSPGNPVDDPGIVETNGDDDDNINVDLLDDGDEDDQDDQNNDVPDPLLDPDGLDDAIPFEDVTEDGAENTADQDEPDSDITCDSTDDEFEETTLELNTSSEQSLDSSDDDPPPNKVQNDDAQDPCNSHPTGRPRRAGAGEGVS